MSATTTLTLTGARVIDPATGRDEIANIVVDGERIAAVGDDSAGLRLDCDGLVISPGLVDLHVHLREPGGEDAETVASGTAAAALGGFTAVCPMANTEPVADHAAVIEQVKQLAVAAGRCDVHPVGAITQHLAGERLAELGAMAAVGVRCFSDDGIPVGSAQVLRRAMAYARTWDAIICNHAEDPALVAGGTANEGGVAARLGLPGRPHEAEEVMIARDLLLAEGLGARLHIPHVSTARAVELIREAKQRGVRVTAEATPHHFTLTEDLAGDFDAVYRVNPPLRTAADVRAIRAGLAEGTLDAIATDHAPHAPEHKEQEWGHAPPGMVGLETALAVTLTELVFPERGEPTLTLPQAVRALSTAPARSRDIDGHGGPLEPGAPANLCVFDPQAQWTVRPGVLVSRSHNTPFAGRTLRGRVVHTLLRGRFTVHDGELTDEADPDDGDGEPAVSGNLHHTGLGPVAQPPPAGPTPAEPGATASAPQASIAGQERAGG